ncbi:MAG TPA: hypothetical protein VNL13_05595 [Sulfolobales archaeon]|nr:hypothetical protein [Sulfolobales archaeon]
MGIEGEAHAQIHRERILDSQNSLDDGHGQPQTLILQKPEAVLTPFTILAALSAVFILAATLTTKWKDL